MQPSTEIQFLSNQEIMLVHMDFMLCPFLHMKYLYQLSSTMILSYPHWVPPTLILKGLYYIILFREVYS